MLLVNCLVNADYYESRGVVIDKYPDKITLRNPGTAIVGKAQMLRGGESEPRNGSIMKMFNLIGFGERAGSGVPDIYTTWQQAGYVEPIVEEIFGGGEPNRTIVTLPLVGKEEKFSGGSSEKQSLFEKRTKKGTKKGTELTKKEKELEERVSAVFMLIQQNPSITQKEIAIQLNISLKKVKYATNELKQRKQIHRVGAVHGGQWIVD